MSNLYFNSLEDREKIFVRLQFDIAISITLCAPAVYMLRMMDFESNLCQRVIVYTGIALWFFLFSASLYVIAKSITGFEYHEFSDISEIKRFRDEIDSNADEIRAYNQKYNTKIKFLNSEDEIEKLKNEQLEEIVLHNTKVNSIRRAGSRRAIGIILAGLPPIFMSGAIFVFYDLDTSSPRKNMLIQDANLAKAVSQLTLRVDALQTNQRSIEMTKENDLKKNNSSTPTGRPQPPSPQQLPPKPKPQVSLESFDTKPTPGTTILNEHHKK